MQFSTILLSAISIGSAFAQSSVSSAIPAQTTVHVVRVSSSNNTLQYFPNTVTAAVGDMVQFQFAAGNHTVTQSTFAQPCQPIALNSNVTGFFSGFMPVAAGSTSTPTYTIVVNNTTPIWVYCSQAMHCQKGMTLAINENLATNKTLAAYNALAAQATVNLPGNVPEGGSSSSTVVGGSSSATASVASGGASSTSSASTVKSTGSAGEALRPSVGLGMAALAGVFALFI